MEAHRELLRRVRGRGGGEGKHGRCEADAEHRPIVDQTGRKGTSANAIAQAAAARIAAAAGRSSFTGRIVARGTLRPVEPSRHPLLARLHARRERHARRSRAYRVAFAAAGFTVVAGGIVLSLPLVPGPGIPLIAAGLAMLALEFDWAERLLERIVLRVDRLLPSPRRLLAAAAAILATAACAIALADVPLLPV